MVLEYYDQAVEIDSEIAPLIEFLWSRDLETFNSCQDYEGRVWVEFDRLVT